MEYRPGEVMPSYFHEINDNYTHLTFNIMGKEWSFISHNSKGPTQKSMYKIVVGLNHILAWAYDTGELLFANKVNLFFVEMYNTLTDPKFREQVLMDVKEKKFSTTMQASAYHFKKLIGNMDIDIIKGIIKYVDENTIVNTVDEDNKKEDALDNEDIFLLTCVITISKFTMVGLSLLEKYKLENYTYEPLLELIVKIQDVMADYYYNVKGDRGERYQKVINVDFKNSLYRFFYSELREEFEKNNVVLFRNNGHSVDKIANDHYVTGICTIYKCIPIVVSEAVSTQHTGNEYWKSKFVNKNTVKYVKSTIRKLINDKLGVTFGAVISTIKFEKYNEKSDRFSAAIKQELALERKSSSDMEKRRKNIKLLKLFAKEKVETENLLNIEQYPTTTPLADFFIVKLLSEIGEDVLSLKLIDRKTYFLLTLVIAERLRKDGWYNLSNALKSTHISPYTIPKQLDRFMNNITKLGKYHINSQKCLESIIEVVGFDYKDPAENRIIHITEEFIQFLINDQQDEIIIMNDRYIYDYEQYLENKNG